MTSIIIYTTQDKFLHKQGRMADDPDASNCGVYYWGLRNTPKKLYGSDRIYFAVSGNIVGYFLIRDIDGDDGECEIEFDTSTWKDIKPISTTSFQGFKYADKVPELILIEAAD